MVQVRELAGWDLDASGRRDRWAEEHPATMRRRMAAARTTVAERGAWDGESALLEIAAAGLEGLFAEQTGRADLAREMEGLRWEVGVVDLRRLLAFQRRLVLDAKRNDVSLPKAEDWPRLMELGFGPPRPTEYRLVADREGFGFSLTSGNPDLQLRAEQSGGPHPLVVHGGSPFFEVAEFAGRWFLRDGYHRAYACLRAGICRMPAVVVRARTLGELGATEPWFFSEAVLFSERPPAVTDFLLDGMCLEYERPAVLKTLRVVIEETISEEAACSSLPKQTSERTTKSVNEQETNR